RTSLTDESICPGSLAAPAGPWSQDSANHPCRPSTCPAGGLSRETPLRLFFGQRLHRAQHLSQFLCAGPFRLVPSDDLRHLGDGRRFKECLNRQLKLKCLNYASDHTKSGERMSPQIEEVVV